MNLLTTHSTFYWKKLATIATIKHCNKVVITLYPVAMQLSDEWYIIAISINYRSLNDMMADDGLLYFVINKQVLGIMIRSDTKTGNSRSTLYRQQVHYHITVKKINLNK